MVVKTEAESISWAKMDEQEFEKFYSASVNAVLKRLTRYNEQELRHVADEMMGFM